MYDIEEAPEEFSEALTEWARAQRRLREPLRPHMLTDAWIAGLVAGTRLKVEHGKAWAGKYSRPLPFVIEMPCPFDHRTEDHRDYAKVRLIMEDDGWVTLDPDSPCPKCTEGVLERWALTCPRCEAGEDHEMHYPDHGPLDVLALYDGISADYDRNADGFDASPVAHVMREFVRLGRVAAARWWLEHTEEAARSIPRGVTDRQAFVSERLEWARGVIDSIPKKTRKAVSSKPVMTAESGADWLDAQGIPSGGEKATWALVKDMPGCPAQSVIFAAVKVRKSRAT